MPTKLGWFGHAAAMGVILASLLIFVGLVWIAAQQVVERVPALGGGGPLLPQFGEEIRSGPGGPDGRTTPAPADAATSRASDAARSDTGGQASGLPALVDGFGQVLSGGGASLAESLGNWASGIAAGILSAAGTTLSAVVLVFFLTLMMLIESAAWREKLGALLDAEARRTSMETVGIIGDRMRRYLLARTILGIATAVLYGVWLWIFGVDLLVVWVLLAFLLNFIPTLGSLIAGAFPVIYVFLQKDFGTALAVGAGLLMIEQVMGNYVDPRVQGRQVSLSSLVVLVALLVWGWVWGIAGAILAVPITIAVMIVCAHIDPLRPFALMLSNATDMEGLDRQAKGVPTDL